MQRLARDRPAIAVLPFTILGGVAEDRYFSDGVAEDIITELSRFRELMVIGRSSSFSCEAFAGDTARVAHELGARYVLEGSVRRAGDRLRITGQLVDAHNGDRIWADRHDGRLADILDLQAEIAARIACRIVPEIDHAELRRIERLPVGNVPAYDLALKACALIARGIAPTDLAALSQAIALAEEAAALDPLCRRAHYARAWGHCRRGVVEGLGERPNADLEAAHAAAVRLRDLDEGSHAAYAILGHVSMRRLRHDEALANLRRAHALNPNDVTTLRWLSWEESNWGLAEDARAHAELSLRLSPRDRAIDASHWALALAAYVGDDLATAIAQAQQAIALNRDFAGHALLLAASLVETGAAEAARAVLAEVRLNAPGLVESRLSGRSYFRPPDLAARYRSALARAAGLDAGAGAETGGSGDQRDSGSTGGGGLTGREVEVLRLVAAGNSNPQIAAGLGLSEHTVKRHVANILDKLALPTRAAAVSHAVRLGLL